MTTNDPKTPAAAGASPALVRSLNLPLAVLFGLVNRYRIEKIGSAPISGTRDIDTTALNQSLTDSGVFDLNLDPDSVLLRDKDINVFVQISYSVK